MKNKIIEFLRDEEGQTSTEYILLVVVVATIIFKFKGELSKRLEGLTGKVFDKADSMVEGIN